MRWCGVAGDLLAWRLRCEVAGKPVSWSAEVAKGRAVLGALARFGLVSGAERALLVPLVAVPAGFGDVSSAVDAVMGPLRRRYELLVPVDGPGVRGAKSVSIPVSVGRSMLGAVARLLVDDVLMEAVDAFMASSARWHPEGWVSARSEEAEPTERVLARAAALDGREDSERGLAMSVAALSAARRSVAELREAVRRDQDRDRKRKAALRRIGRRPGLRGPDLFDAGG